MTQDELDRILSSQETVQPSPTFRRSVMAAIHREATELPPVPFPWLRFALGVVASGVTGVAAVAAGSGTSGVAVPPMAPEIACGVAMIVVAFGLAAAPRLMRRA